MRSRALPAAVAGLALGLLVSLAVPAQADVKSHAFTVTKAKPKHRVHIDGPMTDRRGFFEGQVTGWDTFEECVEEAYCHVVPFTFTPGRDNGHRFLLAVEWDHFGQYDLRLYSEDGELIVILSGQVPTEPPVTRFEENFIDLEPGNYNLAVMCREETDCRPGYDVIGELEFEDLSFTTTPPSNRPFVPSGNTSTGASTPPPSTPSAPAESRSPAPAVLTPGDDGPGEARAIGSLAASQQADPPSNRMALITNIVLGVLLAGVLIGGGFIVAMRIRQDLRLKG